MFIFDFSQNMQTFSVILAAWYLIHKRELPWRETHDPYRIWVSEVVLQQTRIGQGWAYYERFLETFPDINSLASASEESVLKAWQGLGYYARARNMHAAAKQIVSRHGGCFPADYDSISGLKGVGPYTAAAIASISFGKAVPVIDGNVRRFISRLLAIPHPAGSSLSNRMIGDFLNNEMDIKAPGDFNQALMEFGALCCKPMQPLCGQCVFADRCRALISGNPAKFPLQRELRHRPVRNLIYHAAFSEVNGETVTVLKQRKGGDIWQGLYEFPGSEILQFPAEEEFPELLGVHFPHYIKGKRVDVYRTNHQLTHRIIRAVFFAVVYPELIVQEGCVAVKTDDLGNFPVSRMVERYFHHILPVIKNTF